MQAGYYVTRTNKNDQMSMFGPFATEESACRANFMSKTEAEEMEFHARARKGNMPWTIFAKTGVGYYDANETASLTAHPEDHGYNQVCVLPADLIKMDARWIAWGSDFQNDHWTRVWG